MMSDIHQTFLKLKNRPLTVMMWHVIVSIKHIQTANYVIVMIVLLLCEDALQNHKHTFSWVMV